MDVSPSGQDDAGGHDLVAADEDGTVVERRSRREDGPQQLARELGAEHHAALGHVLEAGLALEHDERPDPIRREQRRGVGDGVGHPVDLTLRARPEPAERAEATDAFERPAQLGLEDDDERQQADDGTGLEDLREELEAEELRRRVDRVEQDDADHEAHGAGAADEAEEPVEEERREDDVDDRDRLDLDTRERVQEAFHRRSIVA